MTSHAVVADEKLKKERKKIVEKVYPVFPL
jgi:hypothetical protein